MAKNSYTGGVTLSGLTGLRHRRGMYIGSTGKQNDRHAPFALTQTMQEIVSNSADEHVAGYGDVIYATIYEDNSASIQDFGRGIPKGVGDSFDEVIGMLTVPHTSGKFGGDGYANNGTAGMNGIGLKATNATAKYISVHAISHGIVEHKTKQKDEDGNPIMERSLVGLEEYYIEFNGETVVKSEILNRWSDDDLEELTSTTYRVKSTGEEIRTGTTIKWLPDDGVVGGDPTQVHDYDELVFESTVWVAADIYPRFLATSFLNKGLRLVLTDKRSVDSETGEYLQKEWLYEDGIRQYVKELAEQYAPLVQKLEPITFSDSLDYNGQTFDVQCSFTFVESIDTELKSYANGVPTPDGGPHKVGFENAITKAVNDYLKTNPPKSASKSKKKDALKVTRNDVLEGFVGVFEARIPAKIAVFEGQTKSKLGTADAEPVVEEIVQKHFTDWLYDNTEFADKIVSKILDSKKIRESVATSRKQAKQRRQASVSSVLELSDKLRVNTYYNPETNELYIVEGDSAGNFKRDNREQAILPIRGKVLNVINKNVKLEDILNNQEIVTFARVIGTGMMNDFDITKLRYAKIILAADADADGGHIRLLLLGMIYKLFRPLLAEGYVYIAEPPLYQAKKPLRGGGMDVKMYYNEAEMASARDKLNGYVIQRFKGLGEMSPEESWDGLTNPETRHISQVVIDDMDEFGKLLNTLLGDDVDVRREWTIQNVDYSTYYA